MQYFLLASNLQSTWGLCLAWQTEALRSEEVFSSFLLLESNAKNRTCEESSRVETCHEKLDGSQNGGCPTQSLCKNLPKYFCLWEWNFFTWSRAIRTHLQLELLLLHYLPWLQRFYRKLALFRPDGQHFSKPRQRLRQTLWARCCALRLTVWNVKALVWTESVQPTSTNFPPHFPSTPAYTQPMLCCWEFKSPKQSQTVAHSRRRC